MAEERNLGINIIAKNTTGATLAELQDQLRRVTENIKQHAAAGAGDSKFSRMLVQEAASLRSQIKMIGESTGALKQEATAATAAAEALGRKATASVRAASAQRDLAVAAKATAVEHHSLGSAIDKSFGAGVAGKSASESAVIFAHTTKSAAMAQAELKGQFVNTAMSAEAEAKAVAEASAALGVNTLKVEKSIAALREQQMQRDAAQRLASTALGRTATAGEVSAIMSGMGIGDAAKGSAVLGRELRHMVAIFDEFSRGQRGAMFSSLGAAMRDAGVAVRTMVATVASLGVTMGAIKIMHWIQGTLDWAAAMERNARATGMTVEQYSRLYAVMQYMGEKGEQLAEPMQHFANVIAKAMADPGGSQMEVFRRIGVGQDFVTQHGNNVYEMFLRTINALNSWADSATRAAAQNELFGETGRNLGNVFNKTAEEIEKAGQKAADEGNALDHQTADLLDRLADRWKAFSMKIGGFFKQAFDIALAETEKGIEGADITLKRMSDKVAGEHAFQAADTAAKRTQGLIDMLKASQQPVPPGLQQAHDKAVAARDLAEANIPYGGEWGRRPMAEGRFRQPLGQLGVLPGPETQVVLELEKKMKDARQRAEEAAIKSGGKTAAQYKTEGLKEEIRVGEEYLKTVDKQSTGYVKAMMKVQDLKSSLGRTEITAAKKSADEQYRIDSDVFKQRIANAQGGMAEINNIYEEWKARAARTYGASSAQFIEVETKRVEAAQRASEQILAARVQENRLTAEGLRLHIERDKVEGHLQNIIDRKGGESRSDSAADVNKNNSAEARQIIQETAEANDKIRQSMQGLELQPNKIVELNNEILRNTNDMAEKVVGLYKEATEAAKLAAEENAKLFKHLFEGFGNSFSTFSTSLLNALIAPQREMYKIGLTTVYKSLQGQEIKQAMQHLFTSMADDMVKSVEGAFSHFAAQGLASLLKVSLQGTAGGIGDVLGAWISKSLNMGAQVPQAAEYGITTGLLQAMNAELAPVDGGLFAVAAAADAAATALAAVGASGGGGGMGAIASLAFSSLIGQERGGIIPSAAGGMVVGGLAGRGVLSILHPKEMTLPAHLSEGIQAALGPFGKGLGGGTAQMTYAPTLNMGGRGNMGRGELMSLLSSHGSSLLGETRNLVRRGWR